MENLNPISFSVVIPLYNKENHIKRSMESVIEQDYPEFELIIVDDGSTDNSVKIAEEIAEEINDTRIKIIKQKNMGVSVARNRGIECARSEYICFLDADDMWSREFLSSIVGLINKYPNAGAYATAYNIQRKSNTIYSSNYFHSLPIEWVGILDDYFKYAIRAPIVSASSVVIPKHVFEDVGYFPVGIKRGEDLEMWRKIALKYPIAYYNEVLSTYFQDSDNRACETELNLEESSAHNAEELYLEALKSSSSSRFYKEYLLQKIYVKAECLITDGKKREARLLLFKYRKTKFNKKIFIKTLIKSFL